MAPRCWFAARSVLVLAVPAMPLAMHAGLQQARELAAAKRRLTQQRQASRTQAQRRLKAAARRLALEAAGGSGAESSEGSGAEAVGCVGAGGAC